MGLLVGTKRALLPGKPATRYFVDATSGSDANNGMTPDLAWQTLGKVNGETFNPGESILLQGLFREQLTVPSGGIAGNPITIGVYGSGTIIDGSDEETGVWNDEGANVWSTAYGTNPLGVCIIDGSMGTLVANAGAVDDPGEFFWGVNVLYVYSAGAPTDVYVGARLYGIYADAKSYLIIDGIHFRYAIKNGIRLANSGTERTIKNCTVEYCGEEGVNIYSDGTRAHDKYYRNDISYNQEGGLKISSMQDVEVFDNSIYENWTRVAVQGDQIRCIIITSGLSIHHNYIYRPATANNNDGVDLANTCHGARVFYNVILGNITVKNGTLNAEIYNNVVYDVHSDLIAVMFWDNTTCTGTIVKNNIVWCQGAGDYALYFAPTSEAGTVSDNNLLYSPAGHVGHWGGVSRTTLANWRAASSLDTNSVSADPVFVNPGIEDFHLQAGSPCRNIGADVGLSPDYDGVSVPQETNPAIGALEYVA